MSNKYSAFYCAIAKDHHFLEKPITLSCGHSICQACIPYRRHVTCGICDEINESDLSKLKESYVIKKLFSSNLSELFVILEERFYASIKQFKESVRSIDKRLDTEIEFMKEEVEIQVESLKIELDKLKESICEELHECKKDFIEQIELIEVEKYDEALDRFSKDLENERNLTESAFFFYQSKLKNLNRLMSNLNDTDHHVMMKFNDSLVNSDIIGSVLCNFKGIKGRMKLGLFNGVINVRHNPSDMCLLPNNEILVASYKSNNMTVYDSDLNLIKTIDKIANHSIEPFSVATNNSDRIYICEYNYVIMTDLSFNLIRKFGGGTNKSELDDPRYILYFDDHLYICDCSSMRIQKLSSDLFLKSTHLIDVKPRQIKIIDKLACIRSLHDGLFFYDTHNFQLKFKHGLSSGFIFTHQDNSLLQFRRDSMEMDFFDKNGAFLETVSLKLTPEIGFEGYFAVVSFNQKLVIHSNFKKLVVI